MINLELYRVFVTAARCGSLTKAAEKLYISQPAVSQSVKLLENQLGEKLFRRTARGMELTDCGKMLYKVLARPLEELENAEGKFSEWRMSPGGTIRISSSDTYTKYFLMREIEKFHKKHPETSLIVLNATTSETCEMVKSGRADIGIVNLPVSDPEIRMVSTCKRFHDIFVAGPKYLSMRDRMIPLKELENFPLVMLDRNSNTRKSLVTFAHSLGIHLHPEIELGSIDLLKWYAKANMGIACVPAEYLKEELERGELFEIRSDPPIPERAGGIIRSEKGQLNALMREFIDDMCREEE